MEDALTDKRRWQIRRLFTRRQGTYSVQEASRVLGIPHAEIARKIASRDIDAVDGDPRLTWGTVVSLALHLWSFEEIEAILGSDAPGVLPPLLRVEPLTVNLPAFLVRYVYWMAEKRGISVDQYMTWTLQDGINPDDLPALDRDIAGFREAHFFPDDDE